MKKFVLFLAVAVALVIVGTVAASTKDGTGGIYRDTNHDCSDGGSNNGDLVGSFSVVQGNRGKVTGKVTLFAHDHVAPNSTFNVNLYENPPCYPVSVGTLTTDADGHGVMTFKVTLGHKNVEDVWVTVKRANSDHVLTSQSVEINSY